ncbi:3-oxoacyl synthase [Purpureocillium lilacinum]|uniref:beta-ketoacyl-[acyl-carrier-protein] synthase I n=1 Tax=Purpureocillium lilacinum TaxID=33203 RepID=A0A179HIK2_PURLI|nr:3-oxoacyl synthase [Purpureocillium lilacinum]OAQ89289.1 3-oxoacyl synthase [Purpureocillium lilacinum]
MAAGHIAMRHGFQGPNHAATTACTTGAHSIGDASRFIALGDADVMVAGGSESCIHPLTFAGFGRARSLSTAFNDNPAGSCRPFDAGRSGFVVSEGAAVCVLEELEHAKARGARIYAEVRGYGCSGDAYHMTAPREDGNGAYLAMRRALKSAQIRPSQVDYINAHATGTQVGDVAEAAAIRRLMLGDGGVSSEAQVTVSSTKGAIGHLLGAAGAIEALFCILGIVPATLNLERPDVGIDFNFVPLEAQQKKVDVAVTNSFGFGGTNSTRIANLTRSLDWLRAQVRTLDVHDEVAGDATANGWVPEGRNANGRYKARQPTFCRPAVDPAGETGPFQSTSAPTRRCQLQVEVSCALSGSCRRDALEKKSPARRGTPNHPDTQAAPFRPPSPSRTTSRTMTTCETCRLQARMLVRSAVRAGAPRAPARTMAPATAQSLPRAATTATTTQTRASSSSSRTTPSLMATIQVPARLFSSTGARRILGMGGLAESYRVLGASERLYKSCSKAADYHITEEERKNDQVEKLEDGEELGHPVDADNVWHKSLQPSFSTWSHVTMLQLYLINARLRMLDRDAYRNWQQQLVDHFFFECEKKMHLDHGITSAALRQRYLKDIFVQWRGLLLAYDEGLIKGDAVLASAVWRNLFKGDPAADPRALLAIVGWMRSSLAALEAASDMTFVQRAQDILSKPVDVFWTRLEEPFKRAGAGAAEQGEAGQHQQQQSDPAGSPAA